MDRFRRLISAATAIAATVGSFRPVSAQGVRHSLLHQLRYRMDSTGQ